MSDDVDLRALKLCLEALERTGVQPDLMRLSAFVAKEQTVQFLDDFCAQLKQAFDTEPEEEKEPETTETEEPVDKEAFSTDLFTDEPGQPPQEQEPAVDLEKEPENVTADESIAETQLQPETPAEEPPAVEEIEDTPPAEPQHKELEMKPIMPPVRFKLPNATVNKAYSAKLETIGEKNVTITAVDGLESLGLVYDSGSNVLAGDPALAGEHQLTIHYQLEERSYKGQINLVINNDPKALWKNIPSDQEQKYWKADEDCKGLVGLYQWKLLAASKRGRSHAHVGSCRDDDFALSVETETGWHIAAVSDGAGSCEFSREGSRVIVNNSTDVLSEQLQRHDASLTELLENWLQENSLDNEQALTEALYEVFAPAIVGSIEKIEAMAEEDERSFRDYYSTLLLAAHKPMAKGSFSIAYWIGDGGLGIYKAGKGIKLLGAGDSGDYAGQTRFLDLQAKSPDDIKSRLRFSFDRTFTALVLMSDGISDPLFETDNNLKQLEHWDVFWSNDIQPQLADNPQTSAEQLTDWLDFWSPGNHDDRTLALIYP